MNKTSFTLVGLLVGAFLGAQPKPVLFAYGHNTWSKYEPKSVTGYKYDVAATVYNQLIAATGDYSTAVPDFVMNDGQEVVAWMNPQKPEIGLEEKAYDICVSFGADSLNALAAILAHEVIHHYEKHDWNRHFAQQSELTEGLAAEIKIEELLPYETQADHLGGLLAFSAGFDTYRVTKKFLTAVYEAYGFAERLPGYPSLRDRQQMVENTMQEVGRLKEVWETARLLSLIDEHELAASYYQYLLKSYQGYEVYNNAGVNAALAALQLFEAEEWPFILPLEMDGNARLDQVKLRAPADKVALRKKYMGQAARYFESAGLLKKNNPMVLVNQACILLLQGEVEDAYDLAKKAARKSKRLKKEREEGYAEIVLGIAAAKMGEKQEALEWFDAGGAKHPALAAQNRQQLNGDRHPIPPPKDAKGKERIEDLDLGDFLMDAQLDTSFEIGSANRIIGLKALAASNLYLHYQQTSAGTAYVVFHRTAPQYDQASARGIEVGDSRQDIIATYGEPNATLQLSNSQCLHYKLLNLMFFVDAQHKVSNWVIYEKELF